MEKYKMLIVMSSVICLGVDGTRGYTIFVQDY